MEPCEESHPPRKRCRGVDPECKTAEGSTVKESNLPRTIRRHMKGVEGGEHISVASRSSIRSVYDTISGLNKEKKALISQMGFGGLLKFPPIYQLSKKLTVWLVTRIDPIGRSLTAGDGKQLPLGKDDVHKILGIPNTGGKITKLGMPNKETVSKISTDFLGMGSKDHRSIKYAQEVVEKDYSSPMSAKEIDCFKAAFIVYIMSTLLAPGAKFDYVSIDYWNAIKDPSKIGEYDWCDYVMQKLMDGVVKIKADIEAGTKAPSITGCTIFLQILYLDSLELGGLKMEHKSLPRISSFDPEKMKYMIRADTINDLENGSNYTFGKSKVRKPSECCYTWASRKYPDSSGRLESKSNDLWNTTISLAKTLKVPVEAAGPLFHCIMELEDIFANNNPVSLMWIMSTILRVMAPYKEGFNYRTGNECKEIRVIGQASSSAGILHEDIMEIDVLEDNNSNINARSEIGRIKESQSDLWEYNYKCNCRKLRLNDPTRNTAVNSTIDLESGSKAMEAHVSITAMAKYYLCDRSEKCSKTCCKTGNSQMNQVQNNIRMRRHLGVFPTRVTPWNITVAMEKAAIKTAKLWSFISMPYNAAFNTREPLIAHHCPKYIEVLSISIRDQILGSSEIEMDLFDAILRRLKECEDAMYTESWLCRAKHYIESDFLGSIIAGWFNPDDAAIKAQFVGAHIRYDIRDCKMLFFPGMIEHRWVCYSWDLEENKICIFDPMKRREEEEDCHLIITMKLKAAMSTIAAKHLSGWSIDFNGASVELLQTSNDLQKRKNRSGVLCAEYCHNYKGIGFRKNVSEVDINMAASMLLMEVCQLSGNRGKVPPELI